MLANFYGASDDLANVDVYDDDGAEVFSEEYSVSFREPVKFFKIEEENGPWFGLVRVQCSEEGVWVPSLIPVDEDMMLPEGAIVQVRNSSVVPYSLELSISLPFRFSVSEHME